MLELRARLFGSMLAASAVGLAIALWAAPDRGVFIAAAAVAALLVSAVATEVLARSIRGPIRDLTATADALRRGELRTRVRSRRTDELGALGLAIDQMAEQLSERYEAVRREEGRLRTILDAMIEGVFVTDDQGRIVMTNAALARLAGDKLEGRTAVEAIRSAALHDAVQQAVRGEGGAVELEVELGERQRFLSAHVAALPKLQGVVAVLHDVTELKRADAVRRDFVANASHELRTPLTSIRGFAETLLDGALTDERTAKHFVGNIVENAKRLQAIVEDLLTLSRAESPDSPLTLEPIDLGLTIARVLRGFDRRVHEKRQQLLLEGAAQRIVARADARALEQVLVNLVDNAIKYTPDRGRITVGMRSADGRAVIEVSDSGPGIGRAHLDRIFERFYRVDRGRARAQGGTGLGLAIVRHFVERMGGVVTVASRVGKGTSFRVVLLSE